MSLHQYFISIVTTLSIIAAVSLVSCKGEAKEDHCVAVDSLSLQPRVDTVIITHCVDSIGEIPICDLLDAGFVIERATYTLSKQIVCTNQEFEIPIRVEMSFSKSGFCEAIKLTVMYNSREYLITPSCGDGDYGPIQISDINYRYVHISDWNFDGHPDVAFYDRGSSGNKNSVHRIYLFDNKRKEYRYNDQLTGANVGADPETKTIRMFSAGGHASKIFGASTYVWKGEDLQMVKSVNQDYIDSLHMFVRETKRLQPNGKWKTQKDTFPPDYGKDDWESIYGL